MKTILYSILIYLWFINNSFSALPLQKQIAFSKIPPGTKVVVILSLPDRVAILFGTIHEGLFGASYAECFDFERDEMVNVYHYEREIVSFTIDGDNI